MKASQFSENAQLIAFVLQKGSEWDPSVIELLEKTWGPIRHKGKLFAFEFLSNLLIFIIALLGSIPCQIIFAAGLQAYRGMQIGDVLDLPVLFPLYVALSVFILEAVLLITILVFSFSRCLMWGSLVNEVPTEPKADI